MALSFACHQCGAQRTLNDDGGADPCPECGAGLPGQDDAAQDDAAQDDAAQDDAAQDDAAQDDAAEADNETPAKLEREPLPSERAADQSEFDDAASEEGDVEAAEVTAPPIAAPPVDSGAFAPSDLHHHKDISDVDDFDEGEPPEVVDLRPEGGREEGDMDMTPMVDVTFLLLIFFMITAAFSLQKSIEIPKPEETDQASTQVREEIEDNQDYITIIIDQFSTFRVQTADSEEEAPSKHDLLRKLRRARENAPSPDQIPTKLLVKAHGDATHERVVIALDAGVEVGMEQVQLMTVEEDL